MSKGKRNHALEAQAAWSLGKGKARERINHVPLSMPMCKKLSSAVA